MRKRTTAVLFAVMVLLAACQPATTPTTTTSTTQAPVTTEVTTTTEATTTTSTTMPPMPGGLHVDESRIPDGDAGWSGPSITRAGYSKSAGDGSASFRTNCRFSHMNFDDPIVFPGQTRATHLHAFFGNTDVDASSTPASILNSGNSTCAGGTANRSAYWAPSIIDTATGVPVISNASQLDRDNFLQVYYKTGYQGVAPETVVNFPEGLRIVAGSASSTRAQDKVWYHCGEPDGPSQASMPVCPPGSLLVMVVAFPQCWDGVNLDSADHKSHMAYGAGWPDKGCPSSHPVPLAEITQNYRYRVPASGMANWRLSSDMYDGPAGYSGHADWMNGWDPVVFQRIVDNCYRGGFDCSMNLLGDGFMLS